MNKYLTGRGLCRDLLGRYSTRSSARVCHQPFLNLCSVLWNRVYVRKCVIESMLRQAAYPQYDYVETSQPRARSDGDVSSKQ